MGVPEYYLLVTRETGVDEGNPFVLHKQSCELEYADGKEASLTKNVSLVSACLFKLPPFAAFRMGLLVSHHLKRHHHRRRYAFSDIFVHALPSLPHFSLPTKPYFPS